LVDMAAAVVLPGTSAVLRVAVAVREVVASGEANKDSETLLRLLLTIADVAARVVCPPVVM
jgi:hypothetical protein